MAGGTVHAFVGERRVLCLFCQNDTFTDREIKLNTTGMSLLGLDWANRSAIGLICTVCGRIEMFVENGGLTLYKV